MTCMRSWMNSKFGRIRPWTTELAALQHMKKNRLIIGSETKSKRINERAKWLVYLNHFITGWDDNIWNFALGLFLVEITPNSLQFTAAFGLAGSGAVLLFGAVVGDWVDKTPRLTVARISVLVQNSALIACSILIYLVMTYKQEISTILPNEALLRICYAFIVVLAIVSSMTNMARTTAIERDWIVEICDRDKDMLANLSATMRRISLATRIIAPIVIGQILSRTSHPVGALVVAGWNFMTIFVEYFLLWKIYHDVPQLHRMKIKGETMETRIELMDGLADVMEFADLQLQSSENVSKSNADQTENGTNWKNLKGYSNAGNGHGNGQTSTKFGNGHTSIGDKSHPGALMGKSLEDIVRPMPRQRIWHRMFTSCITLNRGWRVYKSYDVAFSGLSLASLYFTVLAFHHLTVGFVYSQGLSEDLIGGLRGAAAGMGIVGTILYPVLRRNVGLQRTGLYALTAQISCLILCVISVFAPGSTFDPLYFARERDTSLDQFDAGTMPVSVASTAAYNDSISGITDITEFASSINSHVTNSYAAETYSKQGPTSYAAVGLLLAGIIGSRAGLWMADLTIAQLFMETVDVTERGIVNGVQNAINQFVDLMKFTVVIWLPVPEVFGYLVFISFFSICLGWILFAVYVKKARGYLFPCNAKKHRANNIAH